MHAFEGCNRKNKYHKWQNGFGVLSFVGEGMKSRFPSNDQWHLWLKYTAEVNIYQNCIIDTSLKSQSNHLSFDMKHYLIGALKWKWQPVNQLYPLNFKMWKACESITRVPISPASKVYVHPYISPVYIFYPHQNIRVNKTIPIPHCRGWGGGRVHAGSAYPVHGLLPITLMRLLWLWKFAIHHKGPQVSYAGKFMCR